MLYCEGLGVIKLLGFLFQARSYYCVHYHTEDKRAGNFREGNHVTSADAETYRKAADTGDEDDRNREEICVVVQVNILNHFQTAYRDKAVKRHANTAHYAVRNACKKYYERSKERNRHAHDSGCKNSYNRSVTGDCNAAYGFAVSRVRATSEECACDRAYTVAEKRSVKTRVFRKILSDDG